MNAFSAKPSEIVVPLCVAVAVAGVMGSAVWWAVSGGPLNPDAELTSHLLDIAALLVPVLGVAGVVVAAYAWPLLVVLRRLGKAGPASALLVALAPALLLALLPELRSLALVMAGFGGLSGLLFALMAYRQPRD